MKMTFSKSVLNITKSFELALGANAAFAIYFTEYLWDERTSIQMVDSEEMLTIHQQASASPKQRIDIQ